MLKTTFPESKSNIEGYVLSVDGTRRVCSVQTLTGRILKSVVWGLPQGGSGRSGVHTAPTRGDRVLVSTSLTYPVIVQYLTSLSDGSEKPSEMLSSTPVPDLGNGSQIGTDEFMDPFAPRDSVPGDFIVTTEGGSTVAALRGGSVLLKASALSEIFLSRINSMMRLVSRNWEHFTDGFIDISRNISGRVYRFTGYSNSAEDVRNDKYLHYEVRGDVSAGEAVKWTYNVAGIPSPGITLFKRATFDTNGNPLSFQTWDNTGNITQTVSDSGGSNTSTASHTNNEIKFVTQSGTAGLVSIKGDTVTLSVAGTGEVVITSNTVEMKNGTHGVKVSNTGVDLY